MTIYVHGHISADGVQPARQSNAAVNLRGLVCPSVSIKDEIDHCFAEVNRVAAAHLLFHPLGQIEREG